MNGRLSMVMSECMHRNVPALRECFKHGDFRSQPISVRDEYDAPGVSVHRMCFDSLGLIAASRETLFSARVENQNGKLPGDDLIHKWTGFSLPTDGARLIISRVVVKPGNDQYGVPYRGSRINERFFLCALARALRLSVPVYCVVKIELEKQRGILHRMGFEEVGQAISEDIPGQKVRVVVMENYPQRTSFLWKHQFKTLESELNAMFPHRESVYRSPTTRVAVRRS